MLDFASPLVSPVTFAEQEAAEDGAGGRGGKVQHEAQRTQQSPDSLAGLIACGADRGLLLLPHRELDHGPRCGCTPQCVSERPEDVPASEVI